MVNLDRVIEIKKKYTRNSKQKSIYYLFIIAIFVIGFLVKFTDNKYNIKENFYWYSVKLTDFNYEASEWVDKKNIYNGYYIVQILQIIISFTFLVYLPCFIKELKNKIFNNSNLYLITNKLNGTYSRFFKMKEFELNISEVKYCDIKKVKVKFLYGNKKLNIYTNQKKYSIYYIQDFENTKKMIDKIAKENNIIYEKSITKKQIRKKLKGIFASLNGIIDNASESIANKLENKKIKPIEEKLDEINKLQEEGKINNAEYKILREEILNKYR